MDEDPVKHRDERWLRTRYLIDEANVGDMADEVDVAVSTIYSWLDRYGVKRRSRGPTPENDTYRDAEWLAFVYSEKGWSVSEIADYCEVVKSTISRWLDIHNIETRPGGFGQGEPNPMQRADVQERHPVTGVSGPEHPSYIGEDSSWRKRQPWTRIRLEVIERDGEECRRCGVNRDAYRNAKGRDLDVHHIIPTSQGGPRYDMDNLVALCRECHNDIPTETEPMTQTPERPITAQGD